MRFAAPLLISALVLFLIDSVIWVIATGAALQSSVSESSSSALKALPALNVHIIAHTHNDVGWLKTVDQYYYGANESIQNAGVQYILDSVVDALLQDPNRRFIYVEIAFFERWWREQSEQKQQLVRDLVTRGQLEFINGGWCMNDEGATYYSAIIEQMTKGHEFLLREFGVKPRIGWHIDPFGHSATQASLFAQMGFDAFFTNRIEYADKEQRKQTQELEFIWRGSQSLGEATQIFTHVLYDHYSPLPGFSFETGDAPIQDDPRLFDVNVKQRCDYFAEEVRMRSTSFRTNNLLVMFGDDFRYQRAIMNFKNMDKIIKYFQSHPEYALNVFYSTPSIYVNAVNGANVTWNVKKDDFFPYADHPYSYFTGYFTSRPAQKGYVRTRNNLLHATDKLYSLAAFSTIIEQSSALNRIDVLTQSFSIAQHHDAITGTEKQHVANDYNKRLSMGTAQCENLLGEMIGKLIIANKTVSKKTLKQSWNLMVPSFSFCPYLNVSQCPPLDTLEDSQVMAVIVYNPLAWERKEYLRLPVPVADLEVVSGEGVVVPCELLANMDRPDYYTLVFPISLPPMGFTTYFLRRTSLCMSSVNKANFLHPFETRPMDNDDIILENSKLKVIVSGQTGRLSSVINKVSGTSAMIHQDYLWWNSSIGDEHSAQASDAYIFRPNGTVPFEFITGKPLLSFHNGSLVQEVRQVWNPYVQQVLRLYKESDHLEIEATIGPIAIENQYGKEIVSRFQTDLKNNGTFYTDSEGQEIMCRQLNSRGWNKNFTITEPIAGNYYPMNTIAYIEDGNRQLSFVTDRSRGVSSLSNGQMEYMLHRRLTVNDHRGVNEALNETDVIRTTNFLFLGSNSMSARNYRILAMHLNSPPILAFSATDSIENWLKTYQTSYTPLLETLPPNVHLLNLKTLHTGEILLRLHHFFAVNEDSSLSKPVTVNLDSLFSKLRIVKITEMTLTANQPLEDLNRLQWRTSIQSSSSDNRHSSLDYLEQGSAQQSILLHPMQIRTFIIRFESQT